MSNQAKTSVSPENYLKKTVSKLYDFSVDGGAVGAHLLNVKIPSGAFITRVFLEKTTTFASAGGTGTIALSLVSAGDILAAVDADTLTGTFTATIPVNTPATFVKNTASTEKELTLTVATEALTAGKYRIYVEYMTDN